MTTDDRRVTIRLSAHDVSLLDEIAEAEHGGNRSEAIRSLLAGHDPDGDDDGLLTADEARRILHRRAKAGSTAALKTIIADAEADAELARLNAIALGREATA